MEALPPGQSTATGILFNIVRIRRPGRSVEINCAISIGHVPLKRMQRVTHRYGLYGMNYQIMDENDALWDDLQLR